MHIEFLINRFKQNYKSEAIIWNETSFSYGWILDNFLILSENETLKIINKGDVVAMNADFSPKSIVVLLFLINKGCIIVPLTNTIKNKHEEFIKIASAEFFISIDKSDKLKLEKISERNNNNNNFYITLRKKNKSGLVLFSSGSTGKSKASVHDFSKILNKFLIERHSLRTITFLLFDHIGGLNTLFYVLSNTGLIVALDKRDPDYVMMLIEKYQVELLPTTPTFLNLILISEAYKRYDFSTLKTITYGTEPMPKATLSKINSIFSNVKILQTYGLSEVGILRSKSENSNSLWVKIGGEDYQTRIVNDMLEIKAKSAMLGYLNAASPFTKDGWLMTGDKVEKKGKYYKILGRDSEIINVGGGKVYPQEIENLILEIEGVDDVEIYSEKNFIVGNIVCARIVTNIQNKQFINYIKKYCSSRLPSYKVPIKVLLTQNLNFNKRFKKNRMILGAKQ